MAAEGQQQAEEAALPAAPPPRRSGRRILGSVLLLAVALTGWAGWRDIDIRRSERAREQMVQAAREGLLALTAVDHREVDAGVQRILDASTGDFHDDFARRADSFKQAARQAQSTSVGTVTEAGLESVDGDRGRVLVALTVMTSNRGVPERKPKAWRTRATVQRTPDGFKVAAVEFVP